MYHCRALLRQRIVHYDRDLVSAQLHTNLVALVVYQGGSPFEHPEESTLSSAEKRWPKTQSVEQTHPEMVKVLSVWLVAMKVFFLILSLQLLSYVQVYLFRSKFVEILYHSTVVCSLDQR